MGKGDKKSKKGKIWLGSYGNSRRRKAGKKAIPAAAKTEVVTEAVEVKTKAKRTPKKKETTA